MVVKRFVTKREQKLSEAIHNEFPFISYNSVQKLIRQRDIKVDGKRIKQDFVVPQNTTVELFTAQEFVLNIVYEDDNILIVNKPKQIEVIIPKTAKTTNFNENLHSKQDFNQNFNFSLEEYINQNHSRAVAVNRLDRNTNGLVLFAKNEQAEQSLNSALKSHNLRKFYLCTVFGNVKNAEADLVAYLKKDAQQSLVFISDVQGPGYVKIETKYKLIESFNNYSLLQVELVTGKTHQIRAHLAHIGHFVIGDNKYGDTRVNDSLKRHYQCLCSYKIIFNFSKNDYLYYLNGKSFELSQELEKFKKELHSYK